MDWLWIVLAVVACPAAAWLAVRRPHDEKPSISQTPQGTEGPRATRPAARDPGGAPLNGVNTSNESQPGAGRECHSDGRSGAVVAAPAVTATRSRDQAEGIERATARSRDADGGSPRTSPVLFATAYALVAAQFALLAVLVFWDADADFALPDWLDAAAEFGELAGLGWVVLGAMSLGRSLTPLPLPVAHGRLKTWGLYRLNRHPIYTGLLVLAWSWTVRSAAIIPLGVAGALSVLLLAKARMEERLLAETYPDYEAYANRTPRFLPLGFRLRSVTTAALDSRRR